MLEGESAVIAVVNVDDPGVDVVDGGGGFDGDVDGVKEKGEDDVGGELLDPAEGDQTAGVGFV